MDGVIFDSMKIAQEYFIRRHPEVTSEMYKDIYLGNYHDEVKKYLHLRLNETEEGIIKNQNAYAKAKKEALLFVGIKELLTELHNQNYILVLNTSANIITSIPLLEKANIKTLFNFIATAEISKSKTEKFKMIEEKYNVGKEDLLFVTDSFGDVLEAETAGVPTVAVTWGIHGKEYFNRGTFTNLIGIVDSIKELKQIIIK